MARTELTFASELTVSPAAAWSWATSRAGILAELWPIASMTLPERARLIGADTELGVPIVRSWLLLLGVIPIDRSDLTLVELEDGRRFLERSPMWSMRLWQHERIVERVPGGCRLTDRLCFEPHAAGWLVRWFVARLFANRHRVLKRRLGPT